jgi:hypothetical protein
MKKPTLMVNGRYDCLFLWTKLRTHSSGSSEYLTLTNGTFSGMRRTL